MSELGEYLTLIAAIVSALATIISSITSKTASNRNAAKQSIFQMIIEDHIAVGEGKLPTNYQSILAEYDIYHKNGGNSYVSEKVEAYKKWFAEIQAHKMPKA